jgi:hypothetical protein
MKTFHYASLACLATLVSAAPTEEKEKRATPKVYLAGDSTMALGGGGTGTQGAYITLKHTQRLCSRYANDLQVGASTSLTLSPA